MKKMVGILALLLATLGSLSAQDDCMGFFPKDRGSELVSRCYDANGMLLYNFTYTVLSDIEYASGNSTEIGFTITDPMGRKLDAGTMDVRCDNGTFYMRMVNEMAAPEVMGALGTNTEFVSDFLSYPNVFTNNPYEEGSQLDGGEFTVRSKKNKKDQVTTRMYNRQYVKNEKVTTPAGTFDAAKVTYTVEVRRGKKSTIYEGTEWYAIDAGVVRSELRKRNGQLENYMELASLRVGM